MSDERNPLDEVGSGVAKTRSSLQLEEAKANRRASCHCLRWTQENLLAIYAAGNIGCCIFATGDAALRSIGMQAAGPDSPVGLSLSTYARNWILGEIMRLCSADGNTIRRDSHPSVLYRRT
ncbi:hypothetical protein HPB50_000527 [Hyalomma asiaticum]|uniref:Uncharacterized protein n=1 Tax=Hyalomma asiaticum TaxID=266040 RepID=A0ACB7T305_HYAAI|nr:hypothetical protein HPB50_000527 [Hyalomma asiaticum]